MTLLNKALKYFLFLLLNIGCKDKFSEYLKNLLSGMDTVGFHITAATF